MDKYKWYKEHRTIYNTETDKDICIVYEHQGKEDLNLVLNSLNNYPKAVELLKLCSLYIDRVKDVSIDDVQPKLDGIRCIVKSDGMWTRNGKQIVSAPHIFESLKHHFLANPDLVLDGELYYRDKNNFNTICSLVKKTKPTVDDLVLSSQSIEYWIYDVASSKIHFDHRKVELHAFAHDKHIRVLLGERVDSEDKMIEKYGKYIEQGYEGLMIRTINGKYENKRSKHLLKYKTFSDSEYTIVDVYEGKGRLSGKCGQMLLETDDGTRFYSTANGDENYMTELWNRREELIGKQATVKYFELTPDGIPRFPKIIGIRDYE
jgi:ATP-dependent DNA ligase